MPAPRRAPAPAVIFLVSAPLAWLALAATTGAGARADSTFVSARAAGGVSGISDAAEPTWTLVADADLKTLSADKLAAGIGVERAGTRTNIRLRIKTGLGGSSVDGDVEDLAFADAIANPETGGFGAALHAEYRLSWIRCNDCTKDDRVIHTKFGVGLYADAAIARDQFKATREDMTVLSTRAAPIALAAGLVFRIEGKVPASLEITSKAIVLSLFAGGTARIMGGDLQEEERDELFGTRRARFWGGEIGASLQISNIVIEPHVLMLRGDDHVDHIDGLTGVQPELTIRYLLPWDILK